MAHVEANITGTVWKIEVSVGDKIEEGDTVVILESMKMEMPMEAEDAGTVTEIRVPGGAGGVRRRRPGGARIGSRRSHRCRCAGTRGSRQAVIPPLPPALEAELHPLRGQALRSHDFAEGVRAFSEQRAPEWHGR